MNSHVVNGQVAIGEVASGSVVQGNAMSVAFEKVANNLDIVRGADE